MRDGTIPQGPGPDDPQPDEPEEGGPGRSLVILLVLVVAAGLVLWLIHALRDKSNLEDCLMSGRRNCAPITETR